MLRIVRGLMLLLAALGAGSPATAHPHVWITYRADVIYASGNRVQAVRQHWTFDPGTSAYFLMGLTDETGQPRPGELQRLARETAASLTPFEAYTELLVDDAKQALGEPAEPEMTYGNEQVTLSFTLRLPRLPVVRRTMTLAVHDASVYNYFIIGQEPDALRLINAPAACTTRIQSAREATPKPPEAFWPALLQAIEEELQGLGLMAPPGAPTDRFLVSCAESS